MKETQELRHIASWVVTVDRSSTALAPLRDNG